ncbi:MAG: helix-turn-helix transcriptional regulator [Bacteroidota bacterium]
MKKQRSKEFQKQIGERILFLRNKKKWTQQELGEACGIAKTAISDYELGKKNIGAQCLDCIMRALGVDAIQFFRSGIFARAIRPSENRTKIIA